jgi:hypothetical protein
MDSLLAQILDRIARERPCDYPDNWLPVQPPVAPEAMAIAEAALGFRLPELLRRLYLEVGNGGFGPGLGLIPLSVASLGEDPPREAEFHLVEDYHRRCARYPLDPHDPGEGWPVGLVPMFYYGCTVFEFVDCWDPSSRVVWLDGWPARLTELLERKRSSILSLQRRLEAWLAGENVW